MIHSIDNIDSLIEKHDLEDIRDYIYENLKKSIRLSIGEKEDYKVVGSSRVGGFPDVPEDFKWPCTEDNELMTFIAQLNLEEISLFDEEQLLPKGGMLYFFMGLDEPAYDIEHKVIFIEDVQNLKLMEIQESTVLDETYDRFTAYKLIGNSCLEVPNYAYVDYDVIEDDESYFSLVEEIKDKFENYIGCMFGYPEGQHDDSELEAALKLIVDEKYNYSNEDEDKLTAFFKGDTAKVKEEIKDIKMLLEITSDSKVGFQWWDCGDIHFFIRKEDLLNKRFDKTYLSLYSS